MNRRILGPTLLAAGVLVGASLTPRLLAMDWVKTLTTARLLATRALQPDVLPWCAGVALMLFLLLCTLFVTSRRGRRQKRKPRLSKRASQVARLAGTGKPVGMIARQVGMAQDGVRSLITGGAEW